MDEQTWLSCGDPQLMLKYLSGRISARKYHLFACACCRVVWPLLTDERSRRAIELAEFYIENEVPSRDLRTAWIGAAGARSDSSRADPFSHATNAAHAVLSCISGSDDMAAWRIARTPADWGNWIDLFPFAMPVLIRTGMISGWEQADMLRDIVGNPFKPLCCDVQGGGCNSTQSWITPTALSIATRIYDKKDFDAMPILADALEEAGCEDQSVLGHLRTEYYWCVRGCHVIDWLLNR